MLWYDVAETLSYNCLFNFIIGNRGAGKTYGCKKWAIKDYIKTGNQFIYLRRYDTELKRNDTFFNDIAGEFQEHELSVNGSVYKCNGETMGWAIPLSTAKILKSVSFAGVNKIIFDEFIIDKGVYHYLPDEVVSFLEFYQTVSRLRDIRVVFLSNAISVINPYFLYFNLRLPKDKNILRQNDMLVQLVQNEEYINTFKATRFGKMIAGTAYGDYSIENKFLRDDNTFIERKTGNAKYLFTFKHKAELYGVWVDNSSNTMWVSCDVDSSCKILYSTTMDDHSPNTQLLKNVNKAFMFKMLVTAFKEGNVRFESLKIKNVVYDLMKICLT